MKTAPLTPQPSTRHDRAVDALGKWAAVMRAEAGSRFYLIDERDARAGVLCALGTAPVEPDLQDARGRHVPPRTPLSDGVGLADMQRAIRTQSTRSQS